MTKEEIKNKYFNEGEEILWFSSPDKVKYFTPSDIFMIPFTVILGGIMLIYSYSVFMLMLSGESIMFSISGITFFLLGLYIIFGRIWYRHKRLSKNLYFVTNRRVFVFNTLRDTVSADLFLEYTDPSVYKNTLFLAGKYLGGDIIFSLGLDLFLNRFTTSSPAFVGIENPEEIKKIIVRAKKSRKKDKNDTDDFI